MLPLHRGGGARWGVVLILGLGAVLVDEEGEGLHVVVEAEGGHGGDGVVRGDGAAVLAVAAVVGFPGEMGDERGDALLHGFFGVVGHLSMVGEDAPHDAREAGHGHVVIRISPRARTPIAIGLPLILCNFIISINN